MTNREIFDFYWKNGLIKRCIDCQFVKVEMAKKQFKLDFLADLFLILMNYPNDKLNDVHERGAMNSFLTTIIVNNLHSSTSHFYRNYMRFGMRTDDIEEYIRIEQTDELLQEDEDYQS